LINNGVSSDAAGSFYTRETAQEIARIILKMEGNPEIERSL